MFSKTHIPNALTYSRILVIPLFVAAYYFPDPMRWWVMFGLFAFASISDFLDGYLARKWNAYSDVGRALDPVADKLIVAVALLILMIEGRAHVIVVSIILCRELWVAGLREALAGRSVVHVSKLAKWKTATQMVAITVLLLGSFVPHAFSAGTALLIISALLTVITGWGYSVASLKILRSSESA